MIENGEDGPYKITFTILAVRMGADILIHHEPFDIKMEFSGNGRDNPRKTATG